MFLSFVLATALADPAPAPRLVGERVEIETPTGTLFGTIDLPPEAGPWPVALLHPGSGPTDRDGNSVFARHDSLKLLGRALAARGVAVLRVDKRGIGASSKAMVKEADLRVDTYAADAAAWVARLRKDPRYTRVGIVGHSEGALIGLLAAKQGAKVDGFVSLCGLARPLQDVLRDQLKPALPKDLYETSDTILTELAAGRPVKDVPPKLAGLFRPSVQPYLISVFTHDPAELAAAFPGPVLAVSGTTDIQVPVADGKRLAGAKPGAAHVVIEGMNHVLKAVPTADRLTQLSAYTDPTLPLHPKLADELARFLKLTPGK
ncbi:MAG: Alpha/beta hydrolase family protein [Gemmataceae bacterium]|nr:Alpha/beta hydrolase family protein [Gemmataceae bacterium]